MSNDPILQKMRVACIPPQTFSTTLALSNEPVLANITRTKGFLKAGEKENYVLVTNMVSRARGALIAGLFAKELVLAGQLVIHMPMATLIRTLRMMETEVDERNLPQLPTRQHYLVIPDFDDADSVPEPWQGRQAQAWLGEHVSRGGGLVIATKRNRIGDDDSVSSYFASLMTSFVEHVVEAV